VTISPIMIVGALLGVSLLANAALTSAYLEQRDATTRIETAQAQTVKAVTACQTGVDTFRAAASGVQAAVSAELAKQGGQINALQQRANRALAAKPANPADLCGSAQLYLRDQVRAERAASAP
jgi:hypothetical protein